MFGNGARCLVLLLVAIPVSAGTLFQTAGSSVPAPKKEAPLTNADIIKLTKLQLGDDVIIAKIKQAGAASFDLSTDGLVQLKQSSVSGKVISAMLERGTPRSPAAVSGGDRAGAPHGDERDEVRLVLAGDEIRLPANRGDLSTTGMWPVVFTFLDYPGRTARTRTTDTRPMLLVRSEHDPKNYYYLARLDVNDEEDNNRSLKIEQKTSGFTATTRVVPAGRWHVEYDASETSPGTWQVVPRQDLTPGEYGVVVPGGLLYEFGID
jgi:hypothetical protein